MQELTIKKTIVSRASSLDEPLQAIILTVAEAHYYGSAKTYGSLTMFSRVGSVKPLNSNPSDRTRMLATSYPCCSEPEV